MELVNTQRKKIHPHKFTLWVGMGSIIMMFAGLTSAYLVKGSQANWTTIAIPKIFYVSTVVMIISSLTMQMALKAFKERAMLQYRRLITVTAILGFGFIALQIAGFTQLWNNGTKLEGSGQAAFLYVIFGLHAAHVLGGAIALLVMFFKAFSTSIRNYNPVPVEVAGSYWHFVDLLWVYLFVFFLVTR